MKESKKKKELKKLHICLVCGLRYKGFGCPNCMANNYDYWEAKDYNQQTHSLMDGGVNKIKVRSGDKLL